MYYTLKRIYTDTRNVEVLDKSVLEKWITENDKQQIILEVGEPITPTL